MYFPMKLCVFYYIFLNLVVHTRAQDIFSAILGGVQNGISILNNNLGVAHRDYPDYGPLAGRDVSWRSNEGSQSNMNDSEEPYNSNSESRQGGDSNSNSEEYDRGNENYNENKKRFPILNQQINNNIKDEYPNKHPSSFEENIQSKQIIKKPAHLIDNQHPRPLEKESLASNNSMYQNNDNFNPLNVTTIINNGISSTSSPKVFLVNSNIVDKNIPPLSVIDSSLNQNTLTSKNPVTDKTIKKDNTYVLKALTKRKFFFQAKPVTPKSEEVNANETVYYIDFD